MTHRPRRSSGGRVGLLLFAAMSLAALAACTDTSSPPAQLSVRLDRDTLTLRIGHTQQVSAAVFRDGVQLQASAVQLRTTDSTIALVNAAGVVTAIGIGTARIVAVYESAADTMLVVVPPREPTRIVFGAPWLALAAGGTTSVQVNVFDVDSSVIPNPTLTWESSDTTLFTVSASGVVTGRVHGAGYLRVLAGTARDSVPVTVYAPFTGTATLLALPGVSLGVAATDGVAVVTLPDSGAVIAVSLPSLALSAPLAVGTDPEAVAISSDGTRAYVANTGSLTISVIDVAAWQVIATYPVPQDPGTAPDAPSGIAVSPDGSRLFVATLSGWLDVLDAATGAPDTALSVLPDPMDVAVAPGGACVVVLTYHGDATVVNVTDAHRVSGASLGSGFYYGVALAPGDTLGYAASHGGLVPFDLRTAAPLGTILPLTRADYARMTPDGRLVAITGEYRDSLGRQWTGLTMVDPVVAYPAAHFVGSSGGRVAITPSGSTVLVTGDSLMVVR